MRTKRNHNHEVLVRTTHSVGACTSTSFTGARLDVFRLYGPNRSKIAYGDGHGRMFPDSESARQWAREHGYLVPYFRHTIGRCAQCGAVHESFYYDAEGDGSHFRVDPEGFSLSGKESLEVPRAFVRIVNVD